MQNLELTKERNIQNLELATGFAVSGWVLLANLEGISDEESVVQPKEAGNCVNWVAGHILMARGGLLKLLGEQPILSEEEAKPYQQGSPPLKPGDTRLPLDKLRVDLQKTGETISAKLRELPPEKLREELDDSAFPPIPVENKTKTLGTLITSLLFHEGYHAGQLGLLRRVLGKKGVI